MTARYAVFGHPVVHSLSPRIHAAFGSQLGIPMEYAAIDAAPADFANALAAFADLEREAPDGPLKQALADLLRHAGRPRR